MKVQVSILMRPPFVFLFFTILFVIAAHTHTYTFIRGALYVVYFYTLRLDQFFFHFRLKMKYLMRVNHDFRIINFICVFFFSTSFPFSGFARPFQRESVDFLFFLLCVCCCFCFCCCWFYYCARGQKPLRDAFIVSFYLAFVLSKPFLICSFHLCHQHSIGIFCISITLNQIHQPANEQFIVSSVVWM